MKKLGIRNETLLLQGARDCGDFKTAFIFIEEQLYVHEAKTIHDFCEWIDDEIGGAGRGNIEKLFKAFVNPNNKELQEYAQGVKKRIAELKSRL